MTDPSSDPTEESPTSIAAKSAQVLTVQLLHNIHVHVVYLFCNC